MSDLKTIRNIGDKMSAMLKEVNIKNAEELISLGAYEAQLRLLKIGRANHVMYYFAISLGLQGRAWNDTTKDEKQKIKSEFKELQKKAKEDFVSDANSDIPALLAREIKFYGVIK